ncbi:hypothetical protein AA81_04330 [Petrotoga halophila DSM 16923]|nr:hypothetical protein AA81_04330 [Petrotoga halophila DSM 16923]
MIDLETHKVVDMLNSREPEKVEKWLKGYENIQMVSRDGSISYKKAIEKAHPDAIQISDGFHLIKNLTDSCKEYIYQKFSTSLVVGETKDQDFEQMVDDNKNVVHSEKEKAKLKLVKEVRELYSKGYSKRKISKLLNIHRNTVDKYLDNDFSPTNMNKGKRLPGMLDPYKEEMQVLKRSGKSNKEIFEIIRGEGYTGSYSNIGIYLAKRNLKIEDPKEIRVKRKDLIKLLYKPVEEVEALSKELYEKIIQRYPVIESIINLVNEFKQMLKSKNVEKLEEWIEKANNLKIRKIDKFVNGLKRDMQAVRNAIIYEYNNGLAEGSVNKLKVVKRIMYGRNKFEMLRQKVLFLENNG